MSANIGGSSILAPTPGAIVTIVIDVTAPRTIVSWTASEAETVNISGTPSDGALLMLLITNDATLARVSTLGTGFSGNGAIVGVTSKKSTALFIAVNGTFYEVSRVVGVLV